MLANRTTGRGASRGVVLTAREPVSVFLYTGEQSAIMDRNGTCGDQERVETLRFGPTADPDADQTAQLKRRPRSDHNMGEARGES